MKASPGAAASVGSGPAPAPGSGPVPGTGPSGGADARWREKGEAEAERQRTRERLEATLAGLGELDYLRQRQELLVKSLLLRRPPGAQGGRGEQQAGEGPPPRSLEEKFLEENILLLRRQLVSPRDLGVLGVAARRVGAPRHRSPAPRPVGAAGPGDAPCSPRLPARIPGGARGWLSGTGWKGEPRRGSPPPPPPAAPAAFWWWLPGPDCHSRQGMRSPCLEWKWEASSWLGEPQRRRRELRRARARARAPRDKGLLLGEGDS